MKRLLILATIAAMALSTTAQAKPHNQKQVARQMVRTQRVNSGATTRVAAPTRQIVRTQRVSNGTTTRVVAPTNTVVRRYSSGGRSYYYGGGGYYGGYYPYYSSGPTFSIGIGGFGYPGYGYGYGYGSPYYGGYPYSYGYYPYNYGTHYYNTGDNVVAAVQRRLAEHGYYHGVIDGVSGPRTRSAIARWEAGHGMYVDGRINRPLLRSLGLS